MNWTQQLSGFYSYSDGYKISVATGFDKPTVIAYKCIPYISHGIRKRHKDRYEAIDIAESIEEAKELCELDKKINE